MIRLAAMSLCACGDVPDGENASEAAGERRAGFTFALEAVDPANPNLMGRECSGIGTYTLGAPPPTPTERGGLIEDIANYCSIEQWEDGYELDLSAVRDWDTPGEVNLQLWANAVPRTGGPVGVSLTTPTTGFLAAAEGECSLAPIRELSPGNLYADFDCPLVQPSPAGMPACAIHGTLEFRACEYVH
jgi:hypothetical protein